jgi:hypothetical protein
VTRPVGAPRAFEVRGRCRQVAAMARHVRIDDAAVERLAAVLEHEPVAHPGWAWPHPTASELGDGAAASWTLLLSALNFSFWQDEPRWRVDGYDGYLALAHALRRAHTEGASVTDVGAWAGWSVGHLAGVLRGDDGGPRNPPLMAERSAVATELGRWLLEEHGGDALAPLRGATSAAALAQELAANLPTFRDVHEYRGMQVPLLKRAQIAAHDCGAALGDRAPAGLRDRSGLTAFADYKLPQVLRAHGVLLYAEPLAAAVDQRIPLESGSQEEVEIRALTVVAVDAVAAGLRARGVECDATTVDTQLWWRGQDMPGAAPYHRTRSIWY